MSATTTNRQAGAPANRLLAGALRLWIMLPCLAFSLGCYDGAALVNEVRSAALRTPLVEVDLGTYHTTMPIEADTRTSTEVELHLFGTVPRYRVPMVERQLKSEDYRLRHEMLAAIREATADELAEPNLTQLRLRIEKVVNEILKDSPAEMIGFYDVRVTYK